MVRKGVPINIKRFLSWNKSGSKCSMCPQNIGLYETDGFIGEFAHIIDLNKATTRYDSTKQTEELNDISNIILLCPSCHTKIDKQSEKFSVEYLKGKKKEHEEKVAKNIAFANSEYMELFDDAVNNLRKYVMDEKDISLDYKLINVEQKIKKNNLLNYSKEISNSMVMVGYYIDYLETLDNIEKTRLRKTVISIYLKYLKRNESGEDMINSMLREIVGDKLNLVPIALIIISYYFEECDVFEK